jgi:hypothetical protein
MRPCLSRRCLRARHEHCASDGFGISQTSRVDSGCCLPEPGIQEHTFDVRGLGILRRLVKRALGAGGASTVEQQSSERHCRSGCGLERAPSGKAANDFTEDAFRRRMTPSTIESVCSPRPFEEAGHVLGPLDTNPGWTSRGHRYCLDGIGRTCLPDRARNLSGGRRLKRQQDVRARTAGRCAEKRRPRWCDVWSKATDQQQRPLVQITGEDIA